MGTVGLMYVGAVLFINSLMLLGKVEEKSAGIFNLFIGAMQTITPFYLIFTAKGDPWSIFNASGVFLFGFTYLYVGISNLKNLDSSGLGWYSLWVAILAIGYSFINFTELNDIKFGIIWIMWAFLWTLFYLLLAQKKDIAIFTGWIALIQAFMTATVPAFLMLIGQWSKIGTKVSWTVTFISIIAFIIIYWMTKPSPSNKNYVTTKVE
ncbi:AmiS/UreI family transporter [Bacillus smithii]|uniref:AmiS/UreI family transporter n=1 Tax=Bacillus smithii TaxID=1479 RepID=UPI003D1FF7A8